MLAVYPRTTFDRFMRQLVQAAEALVLFVTVFKLLGGTAFPLVAIFYGFSQPALSLHVHLERLLLCSSLDWSSYSEK